MSFKKSYFDSGRDFNRAKGLHRLRKFIPKEYIKKKSDTHYELLLLEKWKHLKHARKVLDAGCGRGQLLELNPYDAEVFGVDIIESDVKDAKKKGLKVSVADLTKKAPFKTSSFDGIVCSHVLEHIADPDIMLNEFKRILKNDGTLVIAVPNFSFKRFFRDPTHKRPYPKEALYRLLTDYGFEDVHIVNGPHLNQFVSAFLLPFPKTRHFVEKLLGKVKPWEILAVARVKK